MKDRLAFSTLGCPDWTLEKILRAGEMGFRGAELRGVGAQVALRDMDCLKAENRAATRAAFDRAGLALVGLGTSVRFHDEANLSEGAYADEVCKDMGIPAFRVFGDAFPDGEARDAVLDRVVGRYLDLLDASSAFVLLETHGQFNDLETLSQLIDRVGHHPRFGLIWDIQHTHRAHGNDIDKLFGKIAPYIRHVHLKDVRDGQCVLVGTGEIDIIKHVRLLEAYGYKGYYSFEWEKRWHPEIFEPEVAFGAFIKFMNSFRVEV